MVMLLKMQVLAGLLELQLAATWPLASSQSSGLRFP
jgi:hypothetical protein